MEGVADTTQLVRSACMRFDVACVSTFKLCICVMCLRVRLGSVCSSDG